MRPWGILLLSLLAFAGCGLGEGEERSGDGAQLRITRDFGREQLGADSVQSVREGQTAMRFLRADNDVETRYGGRFVHAIGGLSGQGASGFADWFYFVNGIEADVGAAEYELSPGDVVQWDYRNWRGAAEVRAIVGAFPEPFVHGVEGRRRPARVECADSDSQECRDVKALLREQDVPATGSTLGASGTQNIIRIVVAEWGRARELSSARALEQGPKRSGVFARFRDEGRRLDLLDERGRTVRTEGPGTGLVAVVRPRDDELVWLVTGGNAAGVRRAVDALDPTVLRDAFAVAISPGGAQRLPMAEEGGS